MAGFRSIADLQHTVLNGADVIRALTDGAKILIFSYSPRYNALMSWSGNVREILGVQDTAIATDGNLFLRHVHPDDRFVLLEEFERALRGEIPYRATYRWIRPDNNEQCWLHCRALLSRHSEDPLFEGCILDISHELTGQVGVLTGPDTAAALLSGMPSAVVVLDSDLRIMRMNLREREPWFHFGDEHFDPKNLVTGKPFLDCFGRADIRHRYEQLLQQLLDGISAHHESRIVGEQTVHKVELTGLLEAGAVTGVLITVEEVTSLVKLEEQITQLRKTEGLRLIATGLAHNFNNALQSILGQAVLVKSSKDSTDPIRAAAQAVIDTVQRTSEMTKQLFLADSNRDDILTSVDLNIALLEAINQVEDLFTGEASISVAFGSPPPVRASKRLIVQGIIAALRLVRELADPHSKASIRSCEGTIAAGRLGCGEVIITCTFTGAEQRNNCAGAWQELAKLLETKWAAIDGSMQVSMPSNEKIEVTLFFQPELENRTEPQRLADGLPPDVLILDYDSAILETTITLLGRLGYTAVGARSFEQALVLLKEHKASIRAVLMDLLLPGMDGFVMVKRLRSTKRDLVVIGFTSAAPEIIRPIARAGVDFLLTKPSGMESIGTLLKQVWDRTEAA